MHPLIPQVSFHELPDANQINFGEVLAISLSSSTNTFTHGLHRYPAKFIPQIPRWAIRQYSEPGDTVLDPFAGSGTTAVEAVAASRVGFAIDLDPLACLVTKAKVGKIDGQRIKRLAQEVLLRADGPPEPLEVPMTGVKNFDHWFELQTWSELQAIKKAIEHVRMDNHERDFFLVVFSSIIRTVSNADDQTQKTYVSGTLKKAPPRARPTFERKLFQAIDNAITLAEFGSGSTARVLRASATDLPISGEAVDLIVSSPPYLDSVDYMYNLMLEYFWLGSNLGIHSRAEYNAAKRNSIGSKRPGSDVSELPSSLAHLIDLTQLPEYRRAVAGPYFSSMALHFREAARVLKHGGRYVLVIGNSRTQAGMLPLHDSLVALAAEAGFEVEHAFAYRIRRHYMKFPRKGRGGIILMDWVITLRKTSSNRVTPARLPFIDGQLAPDAVAH